MSVVVEGIETNEQLELISADGTVTEAQGYLFSRPVPAVRVRQLLNASHGRRLPDEQVRRAAVAIDRLKSDSATAASVRHWTASLRRTKVNPNASICFAFR